MSRKTTTDKALDKARQRGLADALAQERLALAAITKVMLLEVDDPQRVLARLDAMGRAAASSRRTPPGTRQALLDATRLVRRAIERERSHNQGEALTLLDPPKPEPKPERVDELAASTEGPQQLGLVGNDQLGGDAEQAHAERVETMAAVHEAIVEIYREHGALTDRELWSHYLLNWPSRGLPIQNQGAIAERRRELFGAGRLRSAGRGMRSEPAWDLVEAEAA